MTNMIAGATIKNQLTNGMCKRMINRKWITLIILLTIINDSRHRCEALQLTDISVPEVVDLKDSAQLTCSYNMGKHQLNSIKWYKDGMEFFRYAPMMNPTIMTFPVVGVTLARDQTYLCTPTTCSIVLDELEPKTSGSYRCEVSGDAPEFKLDSQAANMTIAALPRHDPIISGLQERYENGDFVSLNCTTDMSNPPAAISWFINGESVYHEYQMPYHEEVVEADGFQLKARSLELHFHVDKFRHFQNRNSAEVKCSAKIEGISSILPRETVKFLTLRPDDMRDQKLTTLFRRNSSSSSRLRDNYQILTTILLLLVLSR